MSASNILNNNFKIPNSFTSGAGGGGGGGGGITSVVAPTGTGITVTNPTGPTVTLDLTSGTSGSSRTGNIFNSFDQGGATVNLVQGFDPGATPPILPTAFTFLNITDPTNPTCISLPNNIPYNFQNAGATIVTPGIYLITVSSGTATKVSTASPPVAQNVTWVQSLLLNNGTNLTCGGSTIQSYNSPSTTTFKNFDNLAQYIVNITGNTTVNLLQNILSTSTSGANTYGFSSATKHTFTIEQIA